MSCCLLQALGTKIHETCWSTLDSKDRFDEVYRNFSVGNARRHLIRLTLIESPIEASQSVPLRWKSGFVCSSLTTQIRFTNLAIRQYDQIWRNFATLAILKVFWQNFELI